MRRSALTAAALAALLATGVQAAPKEKKAPAAAKSPAAPAALAPGRYSAQVKSIVCGGCGPLIEDALKSVPGVDGAAVDMQAGSVTFGVKPGSGVKWASIQKALKDAEGMMGMGADYELSGLKRLPA